MPTEDCPQLDEQTSKQVLQFSLQPKKHSQKHSQVHECMAEVNNNYARSMNKILFDHIVRTSSHHSLFDFMKNELNKEEDEEASPQR